MAKNNFENNYKPHGHLAKSIKKYFKVWMRCDSVYMYIFLTDFDIYLGKGTQASEHGLGHEFVAKWTREITENVSLLSFTIILQVSN